MLRLAAAFPIPTLLTCVAGAATALVISPGRVLAKPFRLPFRTLLPPGRCPGLLSCCTFGAQNLEPHVPAPFGLCPLRSHPIFVFFVALWWIDPEFLTTEDTEHIEFSWGLKRETSGSPVVLVSFNGIPAQKRAGDFSFSVSSVLSVVRKSGFPRSHPSPLVGTDTEAKGQSVPVSETRLDCKEVAGERCPSRTTPRGFAKEPGFPALVN